MEKILAFIYTIVLNIILIKIILEILEYKREEEMENKEKDNSAYNIEKINKELDEIIKNQELDEIIKNIDEEYKNKKKLLEKLNKLSLFDCKRELLDKYLLENNIIILNLYPNTTYGDDGAVITNKNESKYFLFKDKEYEFILSAFESTNADRVISKKLAQIIFEDVGFDEKEVEFFEYYLDDYFYKNDKMYRINFDAGGNMYSSAIYKAKKLELQYENSRKKIEKYIIKESKEIVDKKMEDIKEEIKKVQEKSIAIVGAFVGIVTLISVNVTIFKDNQNEGNQLFKLVMVNLVTTLSISLLIYLINPDIKQESKTKCILIYSFAMIAILWYLRNFLDIILKVIIN